MAAEGVLRRSIEEKIKKNDENVEMQFKYHMGTTWDALDKKHRTAQFFFTTKNTTQKTTHILHKIIEYTTYP